MPVILRVSACGEVFDFKFHEESDAVLKVEDFKRVCRDLNIPLSWEVKKVPKPICDYNIDHSLMLKN